LEDAKLVEILRGRQIPLDVSPTSNVCLGVVPTFAGHPLPRLLVEGLYVTINSDDPPMFNTTLTDEFIQAANIVGLGTKELETLTVNSVRASRLPEDRRLAMEQQMGMDFAQLRSEFQV
jgi:adenosine deaminase